MQLSQLLSVLYDGIIVYVRVGKDKLCQFTGTARDAYYKLDSFAEYEVNEVNQGMYIDLFNKPHQYLEIWCEPED